MAEDIHDGLVHDGKQVQEVLCEQAKGCERDFVFGFVVEKLVLFMSDGFRGGRGYTGKRCCHATYIALQQSSNLALDTFGFPQEALVDVESSHAAIAGAHVVHLCVGEALGSRDQVVGVAPDVLALCLNIGKTVDCKPVLRGLGEEGERDILLALLDHEMDNDERLEDNGPCRVP